jgi:hypothetical protein
LDTLKEKMVTAPILVFSNWEKKSHVHVDASATTLGDILAQPGEGEMDHPISFVRIKSQNQSRITIPQREKA